MDTVTIRNEIQKAHAHEARTHELESLLHRRLHRLYPSILASPTASPDHYLFLFVCNFINRTPTLLDSMLELARGSSREDLSDAITVLSLDFFLSPPPLLAGRSGLNGAMGKSFLCHRLLEELNDLCRLSTKTPLLPVDLSCSNLIVHQLIGRPVANLLDELIQVTVIRLEDLISTHPEFRTKAGSNRETEQPETPRALMDDIIAPGLWMNSYTANITVH